MGNTVGPSTFLVHWPKNSNQVKHIHLWYEEIYFADAGCEHASVVLLSGSWVTPEQLPQENAITFISWSELYN